MSDRHAVLSLSLVETDPSAVQCTVVHCSVVHCSVVRISHPSGQAECREEAADHHAGHQPLVTGHRPLAGQPRGSGGAGAGAAAKVIRSESKRRIMGMGMEKYYSIRLEYSCHVMQSHRGEGFESTRLDSKGAETKGATLAPRLS